MELTPPVVSSVLSQYQLQQNNPSSNNEHDHIPNIINHNPLVKDKYKHAGRELSSPNRSLAVRNYVPPLQQANHHGHQQLEHSHNIEQHLIQEQHTLPESNGTTAALQPQEPSKFFMSSLLNLSSVSTQSSSDSNIPFRSQGKQP